MQWQYELQKGMRFLLTHRLRTALSTLGVLFGVASMVAMLSIGEGAKQETLEQIQQLGMHNLILRPGATVDSSSQGAGGGQQVMGLFLEDVEQLQQGVPYLRHVAPLKIIPAKLIEASQDLAPEILAVTRAFETIKHLKLLEGRFICDQDVERRNLICVLGYDVAQHLGKIAPIGQWVRLNKVEYQIVGVLRPTYWSAKGGSISNRDLNKALFIPLGSETVLSSGRALSKATLSEVTLELEHGDRIAAAAEVTHQILQRKGRSQESYQLIIPQELMQQASRTQQTFNLVLGSIAAISLLVGGIGIMNIMLATVSERTKEIGIRRAVGASQGDILRQFMLEALLLTSSGAVMGIVLGVGAALFINYFAAWKTIVSAWSLLLALLMALGVGICSGLYPALKAAKMDPITALRHD